MRGFSAAMVIAALLVAAPTARATSSPAIGQVAAAPAGAGLVTSMANTLAVLPVSGPVIRRFSPPPTPYAAGHRGVDLAALPGEAVLAALGGVVRFAGRVAGVGWVTVDHGGGLDTTYGPVLPAVSAGDRVTAGQLLGFVDGRDRLDWGARLHGDYIDPLSLLQRWLVHLAANDTTTDPALRAAAQSAAALPAIGSVPAGSPAAAGGRAWPTTGPVTSGFGSRNHPITGEQRPHYGIDIAAPSGHAVGAAAAGTVAFAGVAGGYGLLVVVRHSGGIESRYAHLSGLAVRPGQPVSAGQLVGAVGSTGVSTGPHLHFEVRSGGLAIDPLRWLPGR